MKIADLIMHSRFFNGMERPLAEKIASVSSVIEKFEGEILFSEDDESTALYILINGSISLIKSSADGKERLIRKVEKGEMFAEAAMFSGMKYPVSAIVNKDSSLIIIEKKKLQKLISQNPEIALKIIGIMSNLLIHLNKLVGEISLSTVEDRLMTFLNKLSVEQKSTKVVLNLKKKELAVEIGTISETLSRAFNKLKKAGAIRVNKNVITLLR